MAQSAMEEDSLTEVVLEAGAEDMVLDGEEFEITTPQDMFEAVKAALEKVGITPVSAEQTKIAETSIKLEGDSAFKVLRLIDELDELDDAQHVYSNLDISDEDAEKYASQ